ncbi:LOW QUALITY PROTEIN: magnesium transporter MRS2 homolog, mitochondrial-like [Branchiostoma floridae]|uniref:Magnesium transporter n=1 Tax=Branchiostoma floridae TaxID=7739 RepID=A0A9J7ML01_BRAFL|nr:LOW QUALITY PROTEIN: magnesium transporter MRS2 homolog, mitochondrial-like [Branchiostoma floridae]
MAAPIVIFLCRRNFSKTVGFPAAVYSILRHNHRDDIGQRWKQTGHSQRWFCQGHVPGVLPKRLSLEPDKKLAASAPIFRAVKFCADGRQERFDIRKPALCQELGLQVRDLRFQQQTILQPRDTAIIIRMEEIKAIVSPDCVYILDHEEPRDKVLLGELQTQLEGDNSSPVAHLPLEFKGLEAILNYRISSLKQELDVLEPAILQVLTDLVEPSFMSVDRSKLRVLLQYRKSLTEFQTDVKDYVEVLTDILDYDDSIEEMCLTDKITNTMATSKSDHLSHVDEMELLLENCLGRAEDIVNRVAEVKDLIEDSEQIIFMNLDSHRNVMMRLNVQLTMGTFSIALFGMLGTAFGMNLLSSFEEDPKAFWIVTGVMFTGCGLLWRRLLWFLGREVPPNRKWSWKNFKSSGQ